MNLLKATALGGAMLFSSAMFAQTHAGTTITGAATTPYVFGGTVHITEGKTYPLYAQPDHYFHPLYDVATGVYTLTDGNIWNWSADVPADITFSQTGVDDNYVEITAGATTGTTVGTPYVVTVNEEGPFCAGADQTINVVVYNPAAIAMTTNLAPLAAYSGCEGDAALVPTAITATITEGYQAYWVNWRLEIATLDNLLAPTSYYDDETGAVPTVGQKYAVEYDAPNAIATDKTLVAGANDITTVGSFAVINNGTSDAVTRYTFELLSINDQASRNGDFIGLAGDATSEAAFAWTPAAQTITITVYPAPVTGPIYHIPAGWAN